MSDQREATERWQRVSAIFDAALDLAPERRQAFLRAACGDDAALRADVESLLSAHSEAAGFLERPAYRIAGSASGGDATPQTPRRGPFLPGSHLGPYEIVALLGAGGMGEVYRARDPRLRREVAVKLVRDAPGQPDLRRRLEQEARAAGALNHPNLLAVYDLGEQAGTPYVVTELLEGETLRERLRRGPLPLTEALGCAGQILLGLEAAHAKGIVHRDLKPENLFLTNAGHLKILDFGLAKEVTGADEGASGASLTGTGRILGTLGYTSPEQLRGRPADARSDLFAVGAVLYELLAGERAVAGDSPAEKITATLAGEPPPLAELRREVSAELARLVHRCLAKEPAERFASARELRLALAGLGSTRGSGAAASAGRSIAVLPFVNMSAEADQEYLCEGIAEELTTALTRLPGLRVLARSTSFHYGGDTDRLRRIRDELRVDTVLEGSVRRAGNRLRITVQLLNVADGYHVWSDRYDLELADVLAVQDQIAGRVVEALELQLGDHGQARIRRFTQDLDAYHFYLKGRYYWNKRHEGGLQRGLRCFEQALERDPAYAPAWAGVADSYCLLAYSLFDLLPGREGMERARTAALRALAVDDRLSDAYAALAWVKFHHDWDWQGAEHDFQRALQLDPIRATNPHWYTLFLAAMGRTEEARTQARRARDLDPLSLICNACLVCPPYYGRRFDEAEAEAKRLVDLDPAFPVGRFWLGVTYAAQGRYREAITEYEAFGASFGETSRTPALLGHALGRAGEVEAARRKLAELAGGGQVPAYHPALVHAGLGEIDQAFSCLERAYGERSDQLAYLAVEPLLDPLRSDPRFTALLERLRLPSEGSWPAPAVRSGARRSLAVLPFRDLGAVPGGGNLGLGLADAAITELAGLKSLLVRPTSAILRYQTEPADPLRAGRELGVEAVVDGSFQQAGGRIRVTVRLLATADGRSLWATKIDTAMADLFQVQDVVARDIARALSIELGTSDRSRREAVQPQPGRAYEYYLRGRSHFLRETLDDFIAAADWFEKARDEDPDFALAWAGLADVYARISYDFQPEGNWYERARAACDRSLLLAPGLPEGFYARARLRWSPPGGWDVEQALRDLMAAIAGRPGLDDAHMRVGVILYHVGLVPDAMARLERVLELSPEHLLGRYHLAFCRYHQGQFAEALADSQIVAEKAAARWILYQSSLCHLRLGDLETAAAIADQLKEGGSAIRALLAALRGERDRLRQDVRTTLEHRQAYGHYHHAQYEVACALAVAGESEEAIDWLTAAAGNGYPCVTFFEIDPFLAPLREQPRCRRLFAELRAARDGHARLYGELQSGPTNRGEAPA